MAVLVSFSGLPGVGKSTIAQALSRETGAVYLRIDEIDSAIAHANSDWVFKGPESYHVAAALAASNLQLGHDAIVDSFNPRPITRAIYQAAAERVAAMHLGVELICSDIDVHRRRVESRTADIPGSTLPDWNTVVTEREYTLWDGADLSLDTSEMSSDAAVSIIRDAMRAGAGLS